MNSFGIFTAPMVKELMYHSISNHHLFDATFTEKAIKSLVKRLRQSKEVGCIEKLRAAITSKSKNTECVKIPRSLDGRMQVQHRKTLPHLLYCQIWRWPDIRSQHELKQTDTCKFTYRAKCDQIWTCCHNQRLIWYIAKRNAIEGLLWHIVENNVTQ